jgi:hypothetical protein
MTTFIEFNFHAYMLDCATRLKELQHSQSNPRYFEANTVADMQELLNNIGVAKYPAIVTLSSIKGRVGDEKTGNNYLDHPFHTGFIITSPMQGSTDAETIRLAKIEAKSILFKIIAKMRHDRRRALFGLNFLNLTSIPYQEIGPLGAGSYGVMFNFENTQPVALEHNTNDWIPEE